MEQHASNTLYILLHPCWIDTVTRIMVYDTGYRPLYSAVPASTDGNGQLIHPFKPMHLTSTRVWLHKYMLPWFVVGIYGSRYTINITLPFATRLENC